MGVIVDGMDLPDSCLECRFSGDVFCFAMPPEFTGYTDLDGKRTEWCPLREVNNEVDYENNR